MIEPPEESPAPEVDDDLAADLTALADGSLDPARREEVQLQAARVPAVRKALDEQRDALALLARANEVDAPAGLQAHVQKLVEDRRARRRRRRDARGSGARRARRPAFAFATGAVLVAAVVVGIVLGSGGKSGPTLSAYVALGRQPATARAPMKVPGTQAELNVAVQGVRFPYWEDRFGWRASGVRSDALAGHAVTTVFYGDGTGGRVAYSIVAGSPPPITGLNTRPRGGRVFLRDGVRYWAQSVDGAPTVIWLRDGHRCIVSGQGLSRRSLLALASWSAASATAS